MDEQSRSDPTSGRFGKLITTVGVGMVALSVILVFVGVSGATFHNVLQLGGIALAVIGLILWKVVKK